MTTQPAVPLLLLLLAVPFARAQAPDDAGSCGTFELTPVPTDLAWFSVLLEDVVALPDGQAWSVGFYDTIKPVFQIETFTLAMHWDGNAWSQVPTPSPSPYPSGTKAILHGVDAVAPDDVWAGGEAVGDAGGESVGPWLMVQHFDGSSWQLVDVPEPPGGVSINFSGTRVLDVAALAADDVWFGGQWGEPNDVGSVTWRPLAMHWNGSAMTVFDTPAPQDGAYGFALESLSALASDDIWAACRLISLSGRSEQNVVLHYDGDDWTQAAIPDSGGLHILREVVALAPGDVWVLGEWYDDGSPFALHFNGSGWTEVSGGPATGGATALGPGAILAGDTALELFDGASTTVVDGLAGLTNVSIRGLDSLNACTAWAVGRAAFPGSGLDALAVRLVASPAGSWTSLGQGLAGSSGVPQLDGSGELAPGGPVALELTGALPHAPAVLVVGSSVLQAPFKGGTLVPSPDIVLGGLTVDATGALLLAATWPAGLPSGTSVVMQHWITDPAGPKGFAASTALQATTP